jgi:hypothetical protein
MRNQLINKAIQDSLHYLESNPYLALHTVELYEYYEQARIIIVNRDPRKVVLSNLNKGWYSNYHPNFSSWGSAPGYQYDIKQPNHFFGRIFPNSKTEFEYWTSLTRVGKVSWMYKTIQNTIRNSLSETSAQRVHFLNIDNFSYTDFTALCNWLSISQNISKNDFNELVDKKPGQTKQKKITSWGAQEEKEFRHQIEQIIEL